MDVCEPFVLTELISPNHSCISANSKFTCITEDTKLVFLNNSRNESWNVMEIGELIKGIKISYRGNLLSLITSTRTMLIIDLNMRTVLHKFESPISIEHFKWSLESEGCFYMVRKENTLERWVGTEMEFTLTTMAIPSPMYFDLIPGGDSAIVMLSLEGELIVANGKDRGDMLDKISIIDAGPIACLDADLVCLQTPIGAKFYSISGKFTPFLISKTLFRFDFTSQILMFSDYTSFQCIFVSKEEFLNVRLDGAKTEVNLIYNPLEVVLVMKNLQKLEILVRHNDKIYTYSMVIDVACSSMRTADSFNRDREITEIYAVSKEAVSVIIENLNKKFDESMRKLDKTLAMAGTMQNMSKSVLFAVDKKYEELSASLKSGILTGIIQSFKAEVINSLTVQLENDIKDALAKISYFFQDRLKIKVERNNREEERLKKLSLHMKACVIGFIGIEDHIAKTIKKKTKTLNDFDMKSWENGNNEKIEPPVVIQDNSEEALKSEIDQLLNSKRYEQSILRVLQEENFEWTYSVLQVLNPKALVSAKAVSPACALKLFVFLLANIEKSTRAAEIAPWFEELAKEVPCSDLRTLLPQVFEVSLSSPHLNFLAKVCSKKLEESYKYES